MAKKSKFVTPGGVVVQTSPEAAQFAGYKPIGQEPKPKAKPSAAKGGKGKGDKAKK